MRSLAAPPISHFPRNVYIYQWHQLFGVQRHLKSRHAEMRASENCIRSFTYSFKKIARLHFPRSRLRDPSKIPIKPQRRGNVLTFREKIPACETIALHWRLIDILRSRGGDSAKSAKCNNFQAINIAGMHFSDALPCRASDFPLATKRIYIQSGNRFGG